MNIEQILAIDFDEFFAIFEKIVAVVSELLKKFEKHFVFEEQFPNDPEATTNA